MNFYGISGSDYGNVVVPLRDGGYMLVEQTQLDGNLLPLLIKTDCNGITEWTRAYRMPGSPITTCYNLVNRQPQGIVMLLGYREPATGNSLSAVVLLDETGNVLWTRNLPLWTANYTSVSIAAFATGFVVCGNPNNGPSDLPGTALLQFDYNGNLVQSARLWLPSFCTPAGIVRLSNGQFVVAGMYPSPMLPGFSDLYLAGVDMFFNPLGAVRYGTTYDDEVYGMAVDVNDNVYVCGRSYFVASAWDAMLLRFGPGLQLSWARYFDTGTPQGDVFRDMKVTAGNSLIFCGDAGAFDERDAVLAGGNTSGAIAFSKKYPVSPLFTNYLFSVAETQDGGLISTGDMRPPGTERDAVLIKTNVQGEDNCYAVPFTYNVLLPAYTDSVLSLVRTAYNPPVTDSLPVIENIPIHLKLECNPQHPCPQFVYTPYTDCPGRCLNFYDRSSGADSWHWVFEGATPAESDEKDPAGICYTRNGTYTVTLTVTNGSGTSVMQKEVDIVVDCLPGFPNIITPNGDGENDLMVIASLPQAYDLRIYNRWGMEVAQYSEPGRFWDGRNTAGQKVSNGVYYYVFRDLVNGGEHRGFVQVAY